MNYNFKANEQKWQDKWEQAGVFNAQDNSDKKKFYALVEFPYPSGSGMHVGHIKAYSGLELRSKLCNIVVCELSGVDACFDS